MFRNGYCTKLFPRKQYSKWLRDRAEITLHYVRNMKCRTTTWFWKFDWRAVSVTCVDELCSLRTLSAKQRNVQKKYKFVTNKLHLLGSEKTFFKVNGLGHLLIPEVGGLIPNRHAKTLLHDIIV